MHVRQAVGQREQILARLVLGHVDVGVPYVQHQIQARAARKDLTEMLELVGIVACILHRHQHAVRRSLACQQPKELRVQLIAGVFRPEAGKTHVMRGQQACAQAGRHVQRPAQLVQGGAPHQGRRIVHRQIGRSVADDAQPQIVQQAARCRNIDLARFRPRRLQSDVGKVEALDCHLAQLVGQIALRIGHGADLHGRYSAPPLRGKWRTGRRSNRPASVSYSPKVGAPKRPMISPGLASTAAPTCSTRARWLWP